MKKRLKKLFDIPWYSKKNKTTLNLLTTFSAFKPHGNQNYKTFEPLVIKNINEIILKLSQISEIENKTTIVEYLNFYEQSKHKNTFEIKEILSKNFDLNGSDKVKNCYHFIYSCLFKNLTENYKILEIGLGTNNPNLVSSMGKNGTPGASVRAFRDSFPNAKVFGADIDIDILFKSERIETYFVDQNDLNSFKNIPLLDDSKFDIIIDDGLHYQLSNLNTLLYALENLNIDGYFIIEDIGRWTIETWKIVNKILPKNFDSKIIHMIDSNYIFLVKKLK